MCEYLCAQLPQSEVHGSFGLQVVDSSPKMIQQPYANAADVKAAGDMDYDLRELSEWGRRGECSAHRSAMTPRTTGGINRRTSLAQPRTELGRLLRYKKRQNCSI